MTAYWVNQPFVAVDKSTGAKIACDSNPPLRCYAATPDQAKSVYQHTVVARYDSMGMRVPGFYGRADVIEAGEAGIV